MHSWPIHDRCSEIRNPSFPTEKKSCKMSGNFGGGFLEKLEAPPSGAGQVILTDRWHCQNHILPVPHCQYPFPIASNPSVHMSKCIEMYGVVAYNLPTWTIQCCKSMPSIDKSAVHFVFFNHQAFRKQICCKANLLQICFSVSLVYLSNYSLTSSI